MKAAARVIYRGSWETERPAIMKRFGWEKSNSEVLIRYKLPPTPGSHKSCDSRVICRVRSTPRRFGKTFSCARCPLHSLARVLTRARVLGSIAIFCACLALAFGLEIGAPRRHPNRRFCSACSRKNALLAVVFSPARRASRKLLERIVE